jgi:hypothetical protein
MFTKRILSLYLLWWDHHSIFVDVLRLGADTKHVYAIKTIQLEQPLDDREEVLKVYTLLLLCLHLLTTSHRSLPY